MFKLLISVLAALQIDHLIWNVINNENVGYRKRCIVREIKTPSDATEQEILKAINEDIERMEKELNDKHK